MRESSVGFSIGIEPWATIVSCSSGDRMFGAELPATFGFALATAVRSSGLEAAVASPAATAVVATSAPAAPSTPRLRLGRFMASPCSVGELRIRRGVARRQRLELCEKRSHAAFDVVADAACFLDGSANGIPDAPVLVEDAV